MEAGILGEERGAVNITAIIFLKSKRKVVFLQKINIKQG